MSAVVAWMHATDAHSFVSAAAKKSMHQDVAAQFSRPLALLPDVPMDDATSAAFVACVLVAEMELSGLVLTIEQRPLLPLAMGNYETTVAVRAARVNGSYPE